MTGCWHWSNDNFEHRPSFEKNDITALKHNGIADCEKVRKNLK